MRATWGLTLRDAGAVDGLNRRGVDEGRSGYVPGLRWLRTAVVVGYGPASYQVCRTCVRRLW